MKLKQLIYLTLVIVLDFSTLIIPNRFLKGVAVGIACTLFIFAVVETIQNFRKIIRIKGIVKRKTQEQGQQDR